eukprot:scaffold27_cov355-Prasinococcus_capsulatus_cf.AAC.18
MLGGRLPGSAVLLAIVGVGCLLMLLTQTAATAALTRGLRARAQLQERAVAGDLAAAVQAARQPQALHHSGALAASHRRLPERGPARPHPGARPAAARRERVPVQRRRAAASSSQLRAARSADGPLARDARREAVQATLREVLSSHVLSQAVHGRDIAAAGAVRTTSVSGFSLTLTHGDDQRFRVRFRSLAAGARSPLALVAAAEERLAPLPTARVRACCSRRRPTASPSCARTC